MIRTLPNLLVLAFALTLGAVACDSASEAETADPQLEAVTGYVEGDRVPMTHRGVTIDLPANYVWSDEERGFVDPEGHGPRFRAKEWLRADSLDDIEAKLRDRYVPGDVEVSIEREGNIVARIVPLPTGGFVVEMVTLSDGHMLECTITSDARTEDLVNKIGELTEAVCGSIRYARTASANGARAE